MHDIHVEIYLLLLTIMLYGVYDDDDDNDIDNDRCSITLPVTILPCDFRNLEYTGRSTAVVIIMTIPMQPIQQLRIKVTNCFRHLGWPNCFVGSRLSKRGRHPFGNFQDVLSGVRVFLHQ